jgi:hypothetical protein
MTRDTHAPRSEALGAVQMRRASDARHDVVAAPDFTTAAPASILQIACPRCASQGSHQVGPGSGPHYQRLVCAQCGAFLRWLPKPRPVAQGDGCDR